MAISITTLSGGNTPADGSDPRTFPAIWNATASDLEGVAADLDTLEASALTPANVTTPSDGEILAYDSGTSEWVNQALEATQLPTGSVLQVVSTTKTDVFAASVASGGFTDVTGLNVSITPSSASSKILVFFSAIVATNEGSNNGVAARLVRDSTPIGIGDAAGSRPRVTSSVFVDTGSAASVSGLFGQHLDSPATTSALTYKIQLCNTYNATKTLYVSHTNTDADEAFYARAAASITAMEVAG